jgi:hypothetical protein
MMKIKNPWSQQMIEQERTYFANNEAEMAGAYLEAGWTEREPKLQCPLCGEDAWMHSGIGTYRCMGGHIRITRIVDGELETFWD